MKRCILCCGIVCLGFAANVQAAGEWFVLADFNAWSTGSVNHPLAKQLRDVARRQAELRCVAFTPGGDWVVLAGDNDVRTSKNDLPAVQTLLELRKGHVLRCVAFTPKGGWVVFWDQNGNRWSGLPDAAVKKIGELAAEGRTLRSIAFAPNGGWVLLYDETGVWYSDVPDDLAQVLKRAVEKGVPVHCVAFTNLGTWFALTGSGWSTNDRNHPASKQLAKLPRGSRTLKWMAFAPEDLATARYVLEVKPAQRVRAVLTADFTPRDGGAGPWFVFAPQAPELPGQQAVRTTFHPEGKVVLEASPLKRPFFLTRIEDGTKEVNAVLTIEATLVSRRLRPLASGQEGPVVPDLSAEELQWYTRSSRTLDQDAAPVREWMERNDLKRKDGESDLACARRVFLYIKQHFAYEFPTDHRTASAVCTAGKSDCGGLSALFAATMRTDGVPARLIVGRWAESQESSDMKVHAKAEFFARGVGWVPVDLSQAVNDTAGADFTFFGFDPGDFIVMEVDADFALDSFGLGPRNLSVIQNIARWGRGGGGGGSRGSRPEDQWTVTKEKLP